MTVLRYSRAYVWHWEGTSHVFPLIVLIILTIGVRQFGILFDVEHLLAWPNSLAVGLSVRVLIQMVFVVACLVVAGTRVPTSLPIEPTPGPPNAIRPDRPGPAKGGPRTA